MRNFVSHQWWLRLPVLFVLLALGLVHADITKAQSFEYRLGPGDKIDVKVFGRAELSGTYAIRNSGFVSLPVVGEIEASDLTLGQLETEIENQYSVLMNSGPDPSFSVNIEILEHRPFYIMGDVSRPGSYEYQDRLTVLRAIAIAGGYASSGPDARVSETRSRESLNVHKSNYIAAIAREARLIAERKELDEIVFPAGLLKMQNDPFVAEILDIERQLFTVRGELLAQAASKRMEVDEMLIAAKKLASDGLLAKLNLSSFVIMQADIERESWELVVAQTSELARVRLEIDETLQHIRAEADRLAILKVKTSARSDSAEEKEKAKVRITRETDRGMVSIDAADNTVVLPGDIISVPYQEGEVFLSLPDRGQK